MGRRKAPGRWKGFIPQLPTLGPVEKAAILLGLDWGVMFQGRGWGVGFGGSE